MDDLENWKKHTDQISELTFRLRYLVDNCCENMNAEQFYLSAEKMCDLKRQGDFWLKEENPQRFVYDLKVFAMWLCDFIADKDREFWNEDS